MKIEGHTFVVTGGASGLGEGTTRECVMLPRIAPCVCVCGRLAAERGPAVCASGRSAPRPAVRALPAPLRLGHRRSAPRPLSLPGLSPTHSPVSLPRTRTPPAGSSRAAATWRSSTSTASRRRTPSLLMAAGGAGGEGGASPWSRVQSASTGSAAARTRRAPTTRRESIVGPHRHGRAETDTLLGVAKGASQRQRSRQPPSPRAPPLPPACAAPRRGARAGTPPRCRPPLDI